MLIFVSALAGLLTGVVAGESGGTFRDSAYVQEILRSPKFSSSLAIPNSKWTVERQSIQWSVLSCPTTTFCVHVGGAGQSVLQWSTNQGRNWRTAIFHVGRAGGGSYTLYLDDISCESPQLCLAIAGNTLLRVQDHATKFAVLKRPPSFVAHGLIPVAVSCARTFCLVAGGDSNNAAVPNLEDSAVTANGGRSWNSANLPAATNNINDLSCSPTGTCAITYGTSTHQFVDFAMSTDRGGTWRRTNSPGGSPAPGSLSCPTVTTCIYDGDTPQETINGGLSWFPLDSIFPKASNNLFYGPASCPTARTCLLWATRGSRNFIFTEHR